MRFGDNLRNLRKERKISQEALAEKVNVSRQSVSKWETGEAYPEMNNILQLCKIFNCHINDLVHQDMSDIDSLDEEIKMKVAKLEKEKQNKMKGLSKSIYIIAKICRTLTKVAIVILAVLAVLAPFAISKVEIEETYLKVEDVTIGETNTDEEAKIIEDFIYNHSNLEIILATEYILISLAITILLLSLVLSQLEKLFKNIHDGETPFTLENVKYIKNIAKYLIIYLIFTNVSGIIIESISKGNLGIEFELMDVVYILIIFSMSYIFEYGYEIQKDSKGIMYDETEA